MDSLSCTNSLSPYLWGRWNLFTSDLGRYIRYIVKSLRILASIFFISVSNQLRIVKLYLITGSAKKLIVLILLHGFKSLFRIDLTLRNIFSEFTPHRWMLNPIPFRLPPDIYNFPSGSTPLMTFVISRVKCNKISSVIWLYELTIFIQSVLDFRNVTGVYKRRNIIRKGSDMGSLLSIIYGRLRSSH